MPPAHASTLRARAYRCLGAAALLVRPLHNISTNCASQNALLRKRRLDISSCCAVIATLGPSCRDVETLVAMMEAGMTAARVDLTVGFQEQHVSLATRQLLQYCFMGNDRVCPSEP